MVEQERWRALALSRRQKAIGLCVALWVLWINVGWALRAQALMLGALTVRCNLKPAEARPRSSSRFELAACSTPSVIWCSNCAGLPATWGFVGWMCSMTGGFLPVSA